MADDALAPDPTSGPPVVALLATKLYVPRPVPTLVRRPRLRELLARGVRGPLTLLAAPAGWGKTTLLGEWWAEAADPAIALTWVSLDPRDNDPVRFWSYVIAALRTAHPAVGDPARTLLRSPRAPPLEAILTPLLNELASASSDTALVLDDYHEIDNATIHESLAFFLDHLPPRLHLVISTRADPPLRLARWRARGALVEIRADDLRFTPGEASAFLGQAVAFPLDAATVAALEARTEGWIAGLQLAALAMRDRGDPAGFVGAFSGSHRFVADYLAEEVVQRQSVAVQDFLLRTSILDRMCAPLCQALADDVSEPIEAQRQLERLDRANLFLIPLDGERRWYRYHHLFADLLRARLQQDHPGQAEVLHGRASAWFERAGLLAEAIQHALAAGDVSRAADLLEPVADPLLVGGQVATLRGWLAQLPAPVLRAHPRLLLVQGETLHLDDAPRPEAVEAWLREAEAALSADDPARPDRADPTAAAETDRLAGRISAIRASWASERGETRRAVLLARAALDRLGPDDLIWRLKALHALGVAQTLRGDVVAATDAFAEAAGLAPVAGANIVAFGSTFWLASLRVAQGRLRAASELYHQLLDQVRQQGGEGLPFNAGLLIALGISVDYERDDLPSAERHLEEGVRLIDRQQWPWVPVDACATLARIKRMRGEGDAEREMLRRMDQHAQSVKMHWPWMAPRVAASMAQAFLAVGQVDRAADWAVRFDLSVAGDLVSIVEFERLTAARLLVAQGQPARALAELDLLLPPVEASGRWGRVIEIQALRAATLAGLARRDEALVALGRALRLAEPEGYVRRFVDEGPAMRALLTHALQRGIAPLYVERLLCAFGEEDPSPRSPLPGTRGEGEEDGGTVPKLGASPISDASGEAQHPTPLVEPLSARERDVLRLLVAGRSGPEIAEALVVAHSTVRTHLKSIYGKLDAHSRDQAIARARELKLV